MIRCAFCTKPADSGEHLWSAWIGKVLELDSYVTSRKLPSGKTIYRKSKKPSAKAYVVCAECNNGWMSDLENKYAKPTMKDMIKHGGAVSILPLGVASISIFAFKHAVIASRMRADMPTFFSYADRKRFARTLEIPLGVQMWIGALQKEHSPHGSFKTVYGKLTSNTHYGFELYVFTFVAGHLALQVVSSRWTSTRLRRVPFPGVRQDVIWDDLAIPLFPNDGSPVPWPPKQHISHDQINVFSNRWGDFNVPSWTRKA